MPLIYFVRHGQTEWNAERRIQGQIDVPINETGRAQALRNGSVLAELIGDGSRFGFCVEVPLLRTRQTMEIIRDAMGLSPTDYRTDDRLKKVFFGTWGGMTMEEVAQNDPENYARRQADFWHVAPPQGEIFRDFYARVMDWLEGMKHDAVVVAHGGVSRCLRVISFNCRESK